ncbi:MAG TPA: acyloxyacyl hydrolase [Stellaceae bacterium]|nr:acyloxyacyl hydrolase [Stellaceae bacterium]
MTMAAMLALASAARAENSVLDLIPPNITYGEVKFGVLDHDSHFLGGKEGGFDVNPELILPSPVPDWWANSLPPYLRWTVQPRPTIGGQKNIGGFTDQFYLGPTWSWQLARDVVNPGDGVTWSVFFGPGFNNGDIHATVPDHKSLGAHVLFRVAGELGYQITQVYQVSAYIDHISNGGFARYNQSINDVGARLGIRF